MRTIFLLLAAHYVADFGLQNDFIAKFKVPNSAPFWLHVLFAHCMIQGLGSYLATGSVVVGIAEVIAHFAIDYAKGKGWLTFNQDQACHIVCKLCWYGVTLF